MVAEQRDATPSSDARLAADTQLALAEYGTLRTEIGARSAQQHAIAALVLTATATVAGLIATQNAGGALALILAIFAPLLGMLHVDQEKMIHRINRYIDERLLAEAGRALGRDSVALLGWEVRERAYRPVGVELLFLAIPVLALFFLLPATAVAASFFLHDDGVSSSVLWMLRALSLALIVTYGALWVDNFVTRRHQRNTRGGVRQGAPAA